MSEGLYQQYKKARDQINRTEYYRSDTTAQQVFENTLADVQTAALCLIADGLSQMNRYLGRKS